MRARPFSHVSYSNEPYLFESDCEPCRVEHRLCSLSIWLSLLHAICSCEIKKRDEINSSHSFLVDVPLPPPAHNIPAMPANQINRIFLVFRVSSSSMRSHFTFPHWKVKRPGESKALKCNLTGILNKILATQWQRRKFIIFTADNINRFLKIINNKFASIQRL